MPDNWQDIPVPLRTNFYVCASLERQIFGIRIGRRYLSLAGPKHPQLFTERNCIGIKALPLGRGWRIRLRTDRKQPLPSPPTDPKDPVG